MKKKMLMTVMVLILPVMAMAGPTIVSNGSFETGTDPGSFTTLGSSSTNITGWTVINSVDYIGTYWQAADGSRSLDLDGNSQGGVKQTLTTVTGQTYLVEFYMSGNPDHGTNDMLMTVSADSSSQQFTFTTSSNTHTDMQWTKYTASFVAQAGSTVLTFQSDTAGAYGPALDNVSVSAVPVPGAILLVGLGTGLVGAIRRRFMA